MPPFFYYLLYFFPSYYIHYEIQRKKRILTQQNDAVRIWLWPFTGPAYVTNFIKDQREKVVRETDKTGHQKDGRAESSLHSRPRTK